LIRGLWHRRYPLPLVQAGIWLDGLTDQWHLVNFVLDTGATNSCIHPLDARRLRIPRSALDSDAWTESTSTMGIGGRALYRSVPARYAFIQEDPAQTEIIEEASARLAASTSSNQRLPSLLGWDVLRHFRLTVDTDEIWLERR
jgi:hypothetical protein